MNINVLKALVANEEVFMKVLNNFVPFGYDHLTEEEIEDFDDGINLMYDKYESRMKRK